MAKSQAGGYISGDTLVVPHRGKIVQALPLNKKALAAVLDGRGLRLRLGSGSNRSRTKLSADNRKYLVQPAGSVRIVQCVLIDDFHEESLRG